MVKQARARAHFVHLGPPCPIVPVGDFWQKRMTPEEFATAWELVGPTVEMNLRGFPQPLELWQVFTVVYLDGFQIGAQTAINMYAPPLPLSPGPPESAAATTPPLESASPGPLTGFSFGSP